MDLSIDPGSPGLRTTIDRPPTVVEWTLLQPFIAYAYKKKQHTARMIVDELRIRGFHVTDKVLRTRFKTWCIDDKNKRKTKESHNRQDNRCNRALSSSSNDKHQYWTPGNPLISIVDHDSRILEDVQQPFENVCTQPREQWVSVSTAAARTRTVPQNLNSTQQLQRQRLIGAVANWCDHLSYLDNAASIERSEHLDAIRVFEKLEYGLSLVQKDIYAGRKLLRDAGIGVSSVLQFTTPVLVVELLDHLIRCRFDGGDNSTYSQHASVITIFLTRTSYHDLGAVHPITLLIDTLVRECTPSDLCDMLCKAIELNYVRKLKHDTMTAYKVFFRRIFGDLLITQRRYLDVENWFEGYSADRKLLNPTPGDDLLATGILIHSRIYRGSYSEAGKAISQAMVSLGKNGLQHSRAACRIIELSACLKRNLKDLASCEQLLQEQLRIAQAIGDEIAIIYAVSKTWAFYKNQGRLDTAAQLSESYPDILGESAESAFEEIHFDAAFDHAKPNDNEPTALFQHLVRLLKPKAS